MVALRGPTAVVLVAGLALAAISCGVLSLGQQALSSERAIRAEHLLPLEARTHVFQIIDGDRRGEQVPLSLRRPEADEPGEWVLQFSDLNTLYLRTDAEGNVMILRLDLPEEDYAVTYDPPVRMLPAEIRPHERIDEQSTASVWSLESGELEHTGQVSHKVKFATRTRLLTEAGVWDGYVVPIEHEIDLDQADVQIDLAGGYVPGLGLVYRRMHYTHQAFFGLFGESRYRAAVLAEEP